MACPTAGRYLAVKGSEALAHAPTRTGLGTGALDVRRRHQGPLGVWFHSCEVSRTGTSGGLEGNGERPIMDAEFLGSRGSSKIGREDG